MGYKTISVSDAVYKMLQAERRSDESFTETMDVIWRWGSRH